MPNGRHPNPASDAWPTPPGKDSDGGDPPNLSPPSGKALSGAGSTDRESISQAAVASHGEPNGYPGNGHSDFDSTPGRRPDALGEPRPLPGVPMAFLGAVGMWQDLERAAALASFRQRTGV